VRIFYLSRPSNDIIMAMDSNRLTVITWEGPEYNHIDKGSDWYWALGIIAICSAIAAFFFGNFLFAVLILVGSGVVALQTYKQPRIIPYMVGTRGVRIGEDLYPYSSLQSYFLEENDYGNRLLLKPKKLYGQLLAIPIPEDEVESIELLVRARLSEEVLEEPFGYRLLEIMGF